MEEYIKEFEILEGIPYDKSDEKALAKFERYVERQEKENEWLSPMQQFRKKGTKTEKLYTKEQIINTMHQVELEDDKDYSKLFGRVLQKLNEL